MPIVTIPAAGQYGLIADQPAHELPVNAFSAVENMRFKDGSAERFNGSSAVFAVPAVTPYWIAPYQTSTARYWIHAGIAAVYADDGTTRLNITGTAPTGAVDDRWTGGTMGGVFVMNNNIDSPMFWGGTGTLAALTGWTAGWKAKSLRPFKNYLVAVGMTKAGVVYPHMVNWSAAADPGTIPTSWDVADATKDAGYVDLSETTDLIVDQLVLGDTNIIYKENSMYSMQYVGGQQIFAFKRIPGNFGMLYRGCAVNTPKGHVVLCNGDVVIHQGVGEPQSLLTGKLKTWLFSQIETAQYKRCFVTANPQKNEVWICFPGSGQTACTKALVWNWSDNSFGPRDLANVTYAAPGMLNYVGDLSWTAHAGAWSAYDTAWSPNTYTLADARLMLTSTAPLVSIADSGSTYGGTAIYGLLERTGLAFDAPDQMKMLKSITPRINAVAGSQIYIQMGAAIDAEAPTVWETPVLYTVGTDFKVYGFATGRFLAYRIYSFIAQGWSIKSMDFDVVPKGGF